MSVGVTSSLNLSRTPPIQKKINESDKVGDSPNLFVILPNSKTPQQSTVSTPTSTVSTPNSVTASLTETALTTIMAAHSDEDTDKSLTEYELFKVAFMQNPNKAFLNFQKLSKNSKHKSCPTATSQDAYLNILNNSFPSPIPALLDNMLSDLFPRPTKLFKKNELLKNALIQYLIGHHKATLSSDACMTAKYELFKHAVNIQINPEDKDRILDIFAQYIQVNLENSTFEDDIKDFVAVIFSDLFINQKSLFKEVSHLTVGLVKLLAIGIARLEPEHETRKKIIEDIHKHYAEYAEKYKTFSKYEEKLRLSTFKPNIDSLYDILFIYIQDFSIIDEKEQNQDDNSPGTVFLEQRLSPGFVPMEFVDKDLKFYHGLYEKKGQAMISFLSYPRNMTNLSQILNKDPSQFKTINEIIDKYRIRATNGTFIEEEITKAFHNLLVSYGCEKEDLHISQFISLFQSGHIVSKLDESLSKQINRILITKKISNKKMIKDITEEFLNFKRPPLIENSLNTNEQEEKLKIRLKQIFAQYESDGFETIVHELFSLNYKELIDKKIKKYLEVLTPSPTDEQIAEVKYYIEWKSILRKRITEHQEVVPRLFHQVYSNFLRLSTMSDMSSESIQNFVFDYLPYFSYSFIQNRFIKDQNLSSASLEKISLIQQYAKIHCLTEDDLSPLGIAVIQKPKRRFGEKPAYFIIKFSDLQCLADQGQLNFDKITIIEYDKQVWSSKPLSMDTYITCSFPAYLKDHLNSIFTAATPIAEAMFKLFKNLTNTLHWQLNEEQLAQLKEIFFQVTLNQNNVVSLSLEDKKNFFEQFDNPVFSKEYYSVYQLLMESVYNVVLGKINEPTSNISINIEKPHIQQPLLDALKDIFVSGIYNHSNTDANAAKFLKTVNSIKTEIDKSIPQLYATLKNIKGMQNNLNLSILYLIFGINFLSMSSSNVFGLGIELATKDLKNESLMFFRCLAVYCMLKFAADTKGSQDNKELDFVTQQILNCFYLPSMCSASMTYTLAPIDSNKESKIPILSAQIKKIVSLPLFIMSKELN